MASAKSPASLAASALALWCILSPASAFDQVLCSNQNTGASSDQIASIWGSAGRCHDSCPGYAYAVVQYQSCWCSNIEPANTVSLDECNATCPGFPFEMCGNQERGLFGYVAVNGEPSGTQGGSSPNPPSTSETQETQPPPDTVTVRQTETATLPPFVSIISIEPDTTTSPTRTRTTSSPTRTWSPTPYVSVVTVQGGVQTVTVTPSAPPQAAQTENQLPSSRAEGGFWSSTGRVAGTFTAVGIVIAALIGAAMFFFFKRRNANRGSMTINSIDEDAPSAVGNSYMVDRRRSNLTLATAGLAGLTRGSSNEKSPVEKTPGSLSRRGSVPMVHDQRLNPAALWNAHPNGSHASVASFRDDQDYSRPVLHVRNPDDPDRD